MQHKTSELTGALLDAAVERAELPPGVTSGRRPVPLAFSTDWSLGGPIIERERIDIYHVDTGSNGTFHGWRAEHPREGSQVGGGATPLIAAMRAYVASKLGETVEL